MSASEGYRSSHVAVVGGGFAGLAAAVRLARGGLAILGRIAAADYDVFARRPTLTRGDLARLVLRGLLG